MAKPRMDLSAFVGKLLEEQDGDVLREGIRVLSLDPGDMDTPMHAAAVPDADRSVLKRPETAARELADAIVAALGELKAATLAREQVAR